MPNSLSFAGRSMPLPKRRAARIALGVGLLLGGLLWFLPIVGLWMFPLGIVVLGQDIPAVRRFHRRVAVRWGRYRQRERAKRASE